VRCDYLLDPLRHCGFPARFCNWVSALFSTSTSCVILNGVPRDPIRHGRGLRQGDPLPPSSSTTFSIKQHCKPLFTLSLEELLSHVHPFVVMRLCGTGKGGHPLPCLDPHVFPGCHRPSHQLPKKFHCPHSLPRC
jgi:hypothetical protein